MNRALLIILVPALLVASGYVFVLHRMGLSVGYPPILAAIILFFVAFYVLVRKSRKRTRNPEQ